jgi:hypothetical protein
VLSHLLAPENAAFLVALVAFLLLGLFQIAGFLLGSGLFAGMPNEVPSKSWSKRRQKRKPL